MNAQIKKGLFRTLFATALALSAGFSQADDTEIYFSTGSSSNTNPLRPNVLFILDTSGSMGSAIPGDPLGRTRIQALKDVMKDVINDVQDVNLGLMRFTGYDGGPILFPIHYVDDKASAVVSEPADTDPSFTNTIPNNNSDAEERADGTVVLTDSTLEIVDHPGSSSGHLEIQVTTNDDDAEQTTSGSMSLNGSIFNVTTSNWSGARFQAIDIPQGATITSAYLRLTVYGTGTGSSMDIRIHGQDADDTATFSASAYDLTSRTSTTATVDWTGIPNASTNTELTSPDIKDIIQEIVNRPGWTQNNSMTLGWIATTSGERRFRTHNNSSTKAPVLIINYTDTSVAANNQQVALRFENVQIPQGATVSAASLVFTPQSDQSGATNLTFKAEASDDSVAITSTANNISGRTTTSTSATWSTVPAWTTGSAEETPSSINLNNVLQEVVNRSGWCGGNAMTIIVSGTGLRAASSLEASTSGAPKLKYTYVGGSSTGCYKQTEGAQISEGNDDAEEDTSNGNIERSGSQLDMPSRMIGLRFRDIDIPQGATILEADLTMTARGSDSGSASAVIHGEATDDANQFVTTSHNISDRSLTTASTTWTHSNWTVGTSYTSPDLSSIIQEIVNRSSWISSNSLVLILDPSGSQRRAYSYNGNAGLAPRLRIKYSGSGGTEFKTVRERLFEIVDDLSANGHTPIVEVMDEAARYWRGDRVKYGLDRMSFYGSSLSNTSSSYNNTARISHPGSYCDAPSSCNGATVNSSSIPTDSYGVYRASGCPNATSNNSACASERIYGQPKYISPFTNALTCVSNYQVLLTDGEANSSGPALDQYGFPGSGSTVTSEIRSNYLGGSNCLSTNGGGGSYGSSEKCGVDVAQFLFDNDQSSTLANAQNVRTYTIAFNLTADGASQFLMDMAALGNGEARVDFNAADPSSWSTGFYSATSADDLYNAFADILLDVKKDPTSIASPALATNAFNRLLSRDEMFFGLFTPALETRWNGNTKKYKICTDSDPNDDTVYDSDGDPISNTSDDCTLGGILDVNGNPAIDSVTNKFLDTSKSFWSDVVDGKATTEGGAGAEITDYTDRVIYTETTASGTAPSSGTALNNANYKLQASSWNSSEMVTVRSLVCPTPSTSAGSDCEDRMLFMLGKVITADADTDIDADTRWHFNDVLHSSPRVATYGGKDTSLPADGTIDVYYDKILVGTNEGGLRMINGTSGTEEWSFIPQELLSNQAQLFSNPEADHTYGLDLTPVIWTKDVDLDGTITYSDGDRVRVYIGMRRGGETLYALDITPTSPITSTTTRVEPKFLWRIEAGSTGFERMGQTWSQPQLADILVGGVKTKVLIFGGGYDTALDSGFGTAATSGSDNRGNGLYIINAETGAKILSIAGNSTSGTDADIEVTDMHYAIPATVSVFDSDGNGTDDRIYATDTGGQVWRVDLGSNLATSSPGSTVVGLLAQLSVSGASTCGTRSLSSGCDERRFFEGPSIVSVRDSTYSTTADYDYVLIGSGYRAHPLDLVVQDRFYALRDTTIGKMMDADSNHLADTAYTTVTNANLIDLSSDILDGGNSTHRASRGWYINMTDEGEKILARAVVVAGSIYFTSYSPDSTAALDPCTLNQGAGFAWAVDLLTGQEVIDSDGAIYGEDVADTNATNERRTSVGSGLPSGAVPIFTEEGVVVLAGVGGGATTIDTKKGFPITRDYWYEN